MRTVHAEVEELGGELAASLPRRLHGIIRLKSTEQVINRKVKLMHS